MSLLILPCPTTGQQSPITTGPLQRAHLTPLPPSPTMRRQIYHGDSHHLEGPITTGGQTDGFTTIRMPSGLEVLSALAVDHGLRLTESAPGKAAEHLIRAAGQHLSM